MSYLNTSGTTSTTTTTTTANVEDEEMEREREISLEDVADQMEQFESRKRLSDQNETDPKLGVEAAGAKQMITVDLTDETFTEETLKPVKGKTSTKDVSVQPKKKPKKT
jgi:hypothetical protein